MEAACVRSRRLAIQLAALDEHDLDALTGEVVSERRSSETAADDEHVGPLGQRPHEVALRRPDEVVQWLSPHG